MKEKNRFIHSLHMQNILSFSPESTELELHPLNVLIGPNASGKSNLIEVIGLLRATPSDFRRPIREGGGVDEMLWKGSKEDPISNIEVVLDYPIRNQLVRYQLAFARLGQSLEVIYESIENGEPAEDEAEAYSYYRFQNGLPVLQNRLAIVDENGLIIGRKPQQLKSTDIDRQQSILSQLKDPIQYPELTYLGSQFGKFRLYRDWNIGPNSAVRVPQQTDLPQDFLLENASNLALVLNDLEHRGLGDTLLRKLNEFYDEAREIFTRVYGGTIQLFLREKNLLESIPATRLSDGTIRFLCLLSILCHPEPPPLICIEEPELGMHPDILPTIAKLLIEASQRTQLIVTTHSDALISLLPPGSVLVCERTIAGSNFRRLDPQQLQKWLEDYSLGQLWQMGELGGTRW